MTIQILMVFLYTVVVVISLLLIGIVLIQPAKSGGMGAAFGGIGESVFGAKAGSHLTKATVVMTTLFFVLTLTLAALVGRMRSHAVPGGSAASGVQKALKDMEEPAPAKVEVKQTAKPASKPVAKPAAKPTTKPVAKPAAKPAAKPVAKPAAKPAAKKVQPKPAAKPQTAPATPKK